MKTERLSRLKFLQNLNWLKLSRGCPPWMRWSNVPPACVIPVRIVVCDLFVENRSTSKSSWNVFLDPRSPINLNHTLTQKTYYLYRSSVVNPVLLYGSSHFIILILQRTERERFWGKAVNTQKPSRVIMVIIDHPFNKFLFCSWFGDFQTTKTILLTLCQAP